MKVKKGIKDAFRVAKDINRKGSQINDAIKGGMLKGKPLQKAKYQAAGHAADGMRKAGRGQRKVGATIVTGLKHLGLKGDSLKKARQHSRGIGTTAIVGVAGGASYAAKKANDRRKEGKTIKGRIKRAIGR